MSDPRSQLKELINTGKPSQIISSELVAVRFKNLYRVIHGIKNPAKADAFYHAEQFHFLKLINDNPKIAACTKLSLYGVFMDVAVNGLSFDPSMKHLYVVPYNINVGTKQAPRWEARASLQISGTGELLLRTIQGQIKYADNPVLVYEGDTFKVKSSNGTFSVEHEMCIPRKTNTIIASYLKITRHDDSIDYKVLTADDVQNFRKFSKDPNSKAWTDGLPGMVQSKTIKHAFKNYPKLRVGEFSKVESETIDSDDVEIDYGFGPVSSYDADRFDHLEPEDMKKAADRANGVDNNDPASTNTAANNATEVTPHEEIDENSFAENATDATENAIVHEDENF